MIEHAVENELHAAPISLSSKRGESGISAECRINVEIIVRIVTVVRARGENRVHVDGVHAQRLDIVQFVLDAEQVAAVELVAVLAGAARGGTAGIADLGVPLVIGESLLAPVVGWASRRRSRAAVVIGRVAVPKAVRRDGG